MQGYLKTCCICIDLLTQTCYGSHTSSLLIIFLTVTDCEEYNLVANPIYNISMKCTASNPQETITSTATATRGDEAVRYEEVSNLHRNNPSTSVSDTPA